MAKGGKRTDQKARERDAARAEAVSEDEERPHTEAGAPPAQHQDPRSDPEAVRPPGSPRPGDNTL
jgi:hypothetical protein